MTNQIPAPELDDPLTVTTWPYLYFVSYAHPKGFGHHHCRLDQPATSSKAATKFAELIAEGTGTPTKHIAVLNFQLLSGPTGHALAVDARHRLARHLYLHDVGVGRHNEAFWEQASTHLRARYERRADQILAAITGKEG